MIAASLFFLPHVRACAVTETGMFGKWWGLPFIPALGGRGRGISVRPDWSTELVLGQLATQRNLVL